jgi:hypothetical protein
MARRIFLKQVDPTTLKKPPIGSDNLVNNLDGVFGKLDSNGDFTAFGVGQGGGGDTKGSFGITVDGQTGVITTGSKGFVVMPYNATIENWYIFADQVGSIQFNIIRNGVSLFGVSMSSLVKTSGVVNNISLEEGDEIEFIVTSANSLTRVNLIINVIR